MLFQVRIVTIVHIFYLLSQFFHSILNFLETLSKISIHQAIKSSLSGLIVLFSSIYPIHSWGLLYYSLSMRKVIRGCAAHFLFILIDYTDFLNLLWHFSHPPQCSSTRPLLCTGTIRRQSCLIYLHPFLHIVWLDLLQLGISNRWFLFNNSFDPLLSRYLILFVAYSS